MQWQEVPSSLFSSSSCIMLLKYIYLIFTINVIIVTCDQLNINNNLPPGYYAFPTMNRRFGAPPKVKPPPYLPTDISCPGIMSNGFIHSPKDTLCGDLNKSFIPRNPMGQMVHGQPYPFQLIMNKTLVYLARSLPFLKEDLDNIPKVVKLAKPSGNSRVQQQQQVKHQQQQSQGQLSHSSPYYEYEHINRRSTRDVSSSSSTAEGRASSALSGLSTLSSLLNSSGWNLTESRTKGCEQKDGIMCQLVNSLSDNGLLTQASQVIKAAHTAATTAQNLGSIASLLHQLSSPGGSGAVDSSSKSMITQLANMFIGDDVISSNSITQTPASSSSSSSSSTSSASSLPASGTSNFNPVIAVLDYLASNSQEKSGGISTLLPARRKKPADLDELASEAAAVTASLNVNRPPPTPCPSLEEYIAPVFARNYQGVWKYIVQIPHEGYFTQTVQKTSCMKSKCDFMDGSCHESPRWVSLLVAEIFYPDARLPSPSPNSQTFESFMSPASMAAPKQQQQQQQHQQHMQSQAPQQQQQQQQQQSSIHHHSMKISSPLHNSLARSMVTSSDWIPKSPSSSSSSSSSSRKDLSNSNKVKRQAPTSDTTDSVDSKKSESAARECDGTDAIGCYTVRVYYDWFLVPGSCKCWKKQGSFDALKKIFTGK